MDHDRGVQATDKGFQCAAQVQSRRRAEIQPECAEKAVYDQGNEKARDAFLEQMRYAPGVGTGKQQIARDHEKQRDRTEGERGSDVEQVPVFARCGDIVPQAVGGRMHEHHEAGADHTNIIQKIVVPFFHKQRPPCPRSQVLGRKSVSIGPAGDQQG